MLDKILVVCLAYSAGEEMQEFTDTNNNSYTDYLKACGMFQCQCHLYNNNQNGEWELFCNRTDINRHTA